MVVAGVVLLLILGHRAYRELVSREEVGMLGLGRLGLMDYRGLVMVVARAEVVMMGYRGFVMLVPREEVVMIGLVRVGGGAGTEAQGLEGVIDDGLGGLNVML